MQFIDATDLFEPLRKNLGKKNCRLTDAHIERICETLLSFEESEGSKIFPNEAFGYWKVTVERPLRLRVDLSGDARARFRRACTKEKETPLANLIDRVANVSKRGRTKTSTLS